MHFIEDMGEPPTDKHEIDRKDNDGNYSCGHCEECLRNGWVANCRWATRTEQMRNTSRNVYYEFDGKRLTVKEWAELIGVPLRTLVHRFDAGWSVERALTTPRKIKSDPPPTAPECCPPNLVSGES